MKTTSLKTIYLSKDELQQAIADFVSKSDKPLGTHVRKSACEMLWSQSGDEFMVSLGEEIKDKVLPNAHGMSRILRIAEQAIDKHGVAIDKILDTIENRSLKKQGQEKYVGSQDLKKT